MNADPHHAAEIIAERRKKITRINLNDSINPCIQVEIVHVATKQHNNILFHEQHGQVAMHDVLLLSINMASLFS